MNELTVLRIISFKQLDEVIEIVNNNLFTNNIKPEIITTNDTIFISSTNIHVHLKVDNNLSSDILQFPSNNIQACIVDIVYEAKYHTITLSKALEYLTTVLSAFSNEELNYIWASMPLIQALPNKIVQNNLSDFAIIWRDHFLEENLPLLQGFEKLGVNANWILTLAKGDKTIKRHRIAAYFKEKGYYGVDTLPNLISEFNDNASEIDRVIDLIKQFVTLARSQNKKIMLVDDGGILSSYFANQQNWFDCAVEVTIVGIRKLLGLSQLIIPIYDLGRSELKTKITYKEIALSCVNRIRELIPGEKFVGRRILILGYGTAGSIVAKLFNDIGVHVAIVDTDILKLIEAEENGFKTFRSCSLALANHKPFLIVGCSGNTSLKQSDFLLLSDNAYVTGIATKDLEDLRSSNIITSTHIPKRGYVHHLSSGKCFIQLGDGQSINLFESEAIPNRANDIFKSAILLAAADLSCHFNSITPGIHLESVNDLLRRSSIYSDYYELYYSQ